MMFPPSQSEIEDRIWRHTVLHAQRLGYRFGDGSESDVRHKAGDAASRIVKPVAGPGVLDPAAPLNRITLEIAVRQGEVAMEVLVEEMIRAANSISGYAADSPGVIGEQTFAAAISSLCPVWPIC